MTCATEQQIELMSHALGASKFYEHKGFYRNYFATYADGNDAAAWREMVTIGLAVQGRSMPQASGDMIYYHVTDAGQNIVREKCRDDRHKREQEQKKIPRSKRRYHAYVEISETTSESYGEWLKNPAWNEWRRERGIS